MSSIEEIITKKHMMLFSGTAHPSLTEEIAKHLGVDRQIVRIGCEQHLGLVEDFPRRDDVAIVEPLEQQFREHEM